MARDKDQMDRDDENMFLDDPEELMAQALAEEEEEPTVDEIELDAVKAERDELKDRLLRALAESENIRKRAERDRRDAELYGGVKLARLRMFSDSARARSRRSFSSSRSALTA